MLSIFNELLYRPLFNLLIWIYGLIPGGDFGVAIIALTVLIRILLFPFSLRALRSQRELSRLNPKIQELRTKYKDNYTAQSAALSQLYKEHKINPLSGCLPLLIQIPVLIALYRAFLAGFQADSLQLLYGFISHPAEISAISFGFFNLAQPNILLAAATGLAQFFQGYLSFSSPASTSTPQAAALSRQMLYFFPVLIIIISWNLPAGLTLYWFTSTIFSIGEQVLIRRGSQKSESDTTTIKPSRNP